MPRHSDLKKRMCRPVRLGTEYQLTPVRARRLYNLINESVFRNRLTPCEIIIRPLRSAWGWCVGLEKQDEYYCKIKLPPCWPFEQYAITALAHEMCHQFQWENLTIKRQQQGLPAIMSHGPSFFSWRDALARQGIPLHVYMLPPVTFLEKHLATLH